MPTTRLLLSDYHKMSDAERTNRVRELVDVGRGPLNGELADLTAAITSLELRHQMSTKTMRSRVESSAIDHTPDICRWQILAEVRDRVCRAQ
jgi:hypothetical protein